MAIRHFDVTIGAAATQVSSTRYGIRHLVIQNISGNGAIYIGASTVSASSYGQTIADGATTAAIGPFSGGAPVNTTDVYIAGTQGKVVHCLCITQ